MERKQPILSEYFKLPNPGLRAYFQRTINGNDSDYRPPFWDHADRATVLSMWQKVIDGLGVQKKWPTLYAYEMEMKGKVGPLSIQLPLKDRIESIEAYYTRSIIGKSVEIPKGAIDATISYFGKAKGIRLRSKEETIENMRLSTNSGNPWFTKRKRVVEDVLASTLTSKGDEWWMKTPQGEFKVAAILGWRGQEGGIEADDVKQRVIWMMSVLLNLYELQFYQPCIKAIQQNDLIPAYISMDRVDLQVTKLFESKAPKDLVICTDFTKFDQSFNLHMQNAAESVWKGLASNESALKEWFSTIYPVKFRLPLICSGDLAFYGPHGMGSGSGGTNADECMAHKALQFDACMKNHTILNQYSMAYGDDGILTAPHLGVDEIIKAYSSHGMEMNPDKQYVSTEDCVVLRRWHSTSYRNKDGIMVGVYSTFRALGRLLGQERYYDPDSWGPEMVTLRAWSILENCNHSPYFEEFVNFVMKGDKYRLGLDIHGFMERVNKIASEAADMLPDFLGYTKTLQGDRGRSPGIKNWRIYKYLRSLQK